jgi:flagellar export protein FliJ
MKKYAFRLETVRRVRKAQEAVAKADLARANNEVTAAITAVEARIAAYEAKLAETPASGISPSGGTIVRVDAFMKRRYFNELSANAVIAARSSLNAAQLEADIARGAWSEKAKEVKALDRLDERRREEHVLAYNRELDAEVDDIVTGRFSYLKDAQ